MPPLYELLHLIFVQTNHGGDRGIPGRAPRFLAVGAPSTRDADLGPEILPAWEALECERGEGRGPFCRCVYLQG